MSQQTPITPRQFEQIEKFFTTLATMRKYQKSFFSGNKSIQRTAMYWENQVDNDLKRLSLDLNIKIELPKGPPSQSSFL